MIFHHVLDEVFSTWSHVAVLRVLQDAAKGVGGREISRMAGMSHRASLQALTALENLSVVSRQRGGRDHLFSLNREHRIVSKGVLPLLALEQDFLGQLQQFLKNGLGKECRSVVLFGSVARREETLTSDVDLCIVLRNARDREKIRARVHEIAPEVKRQFGANLAVLMMSEADFVRRARRNKPPVANILRDGIVVLGATLRELAHG